MRHNGIPSIKNLIPSLLQARNSRCETHEFGIIQIAHKLQEVPVTR